MRYESLGPLFEAAGYVCACCEMVRLLLDELESVPVHLELLDAVLRTRHGNRWWEHLQDDGQEGGA